ncbi:MAG: ABC transporter ATP-binding protein [Rubrivivax sp.]|nr:ABC transporter ATP-binding protein [Pyrinomonadaceae bacterium]
MRHGAAKVRPPGPKESETVSEQKTTLRLERVTKRFGDFTAVDELSLSVRAGRVYGLLGPNGAGKTTTIRMITGITRPDEGTVELFGQNITPDLQNRIGYLPEERGLYKRMKIGDQLKFFAELKNVPGREADAKIDRWLEKVKLTEWKRKKASELSKGMQQKIQFIAAVMHDPDLLILDEPFSGLDPVNVGLLKDLVLELKAAGKTIIFSTHQMEVAEKICDDICLINRSRKVLDGSIREVKRGFGRNSVALRFEGGDGVLDDRNLVASVEQHSDESEALLAPGADAQELLRRLLATGASISKFELVEPSLNDIFIEKVGGAE